MDTYTSQESKLEKKKQFILTGKGDIQYTSLGLLDALRLIFGRKVKQKPWVFETEEITIEGKKFNPNSPAKALSREEAKTMPINAYEAKLIYGWWKDMNREQNTDEFALIRMIKSFIEA